MISKIIIISLKQHEQILAPQECYFWDKPGNALGCIILSIVSLCDIYYAQLSITKEDRPNLSFRTFKPSWSVSRKDNKYFSWVQRKKTHCGNSSVSSWETFKMVYDGLHYEFQDGLPHSRWFTLRISIVSDQELIKS